MSSCWYSKMTELSYYTTTTGIHHDHPPAATATRLPLFHQSGFDPARKVSRTQQSGSCTTVPYTTATRAQQPVTTAHTPCMLQALVSARVSTPVYRTNKVLHQRPPSVRSTLVAAVVAAVWHDAAQHAPRIHRKPASALPKVPMGPAPWGPRQAAVHRHYLPYLSYTFTACRT